jgi:putative ABC transport system permease protein
MQDFRFALRTIAAHRWFSAAIVATLALGIGINTTVFTLANAVLLKPLPFPQGERIVTVVSTRPSQNQPRMSVSYRDFLDLRAQTTAFDMLEAAAFDSAVISDTDVSAARYRMGRVTGGLFKLTSTPPLIGRDFSTADETPGASGVVILSASVWRSRYQSSPAVIGRLVHVNEKPATVIGVMPDGFHFPNTEDVWMPLAPEGREREARDAYSLLVVGRMKAGQTVSTAAREVNVVAARLAAAYPDTNKEVGGNVITFNDRFNGDRVRTVFLLMFGAVALVLLIACANVANMLLGRALLRQREMTIRTALGASRWQIVRQLLVESVLLSSIGGVIGLGIAVFGIHAFDRAVQDVGKPSWILFTVDYHVLLYFAAVCIGSGIVFGLAPALRSSRVDLNHVLKEGGRAGSARGGWLAGALVVVQFTLAVILLTASGLLLRSFLASDSVNAWVPREHVITARVTLPESRYPDKTARFRFFDGLNTELAHLPGATHAAAMTAAPGLGSPVLRLETEGALVDVPADRRTAATVAVSADYFPMMGLPITRGRNFESGDGEVGHEVAIITPAFAASFWPGQDPIGRRLRFNGEHTPDPWATVIGVSGDIVQSSNEAEPSAVVFIPFRQSDMQSGMLAVRTTGDASSLANLVRQKVQRVDADLALFDVKTISELLVSQRWPYRVFGTLFFVFALMALLMASVGLYAVMSQATGRRTREIGIRMALGATPAAILGTVMRRGVMQLGIGLVGGLAAAVATTRAMRVLLIGVQPNDPVTFVVSAGLLLMVGSLACWLPARRASAVAPVQALAHQDRG